MNEEAILDLTTRLVCDLFKEFANCSLQEFETLTYENAIRKFGCDKPDLRIPLFLEDIKGLVKDQEFKVFSDPANDENSRVVALRIPDGAKFTRAKIDEYTNFVAKLGAKGLAYKKGIFGAPTFIVKDKIFWGQDRLQYAIAEAVK